jgi:acyl-CoA thioesterase I
MQKLFNGLVVLVVTTILGLSVSAQNFAPKDAPAAASAKAHSGVAAGQRSLPVVVFLGDSLTEGYGVAAELAYPKLLENDLRLRGKPVKVINASVSGSTSASAPARMQQVLKKKPKVVVLALGANDALRGLKPNAMQANLTTAIESACNQKVIVVLAGIQIPARYGPKYAAEFGQVFKTLQKKYNLPLVDGFLSVVMGKSELNQDDGLHPNEKGHRKMADQMLPALEQVL